MYQVFLTKGEYEPWWFFDDWKTLVIKKVDCSNFKEAHQVYEQYSSELSSRYPFQKNKTPFLKAYWCEEEMEYCESCEDDIQIFHGVMLLHDEQILEL
ncbi:DUF1033 family protein [Jeotgalibaca ciconiae]|uniref:DUF1033 family protein n=1 Tax=Jeotgalibaca ciconiae TaxID=2496265 RepID=A0A3S9HD20_9LACT|nr:DUF1033 family protein [Jeotgalibaca ciconiae]AZP05268.1 DUF1033 family protein [Jeotgalibaca ciconiae]